MPSGLNATLFTASSWPVSGCADRLPGAGVPQPHRVVEAAGGDAGAVGAERHAGHRVGVAGERLADRLPGVGVPQPHRVVVAAGGDARAVGAERHAVHRAGVAGERLRRSACPVSASHSRTVSSALPETMRVPSGLNATLATASVWPVSGWPMGLPGVGVPQPHRVVGAAGGDARAVGAERHAGHRVGVAGERLRRSAARCRASHSRTVLSALPEAMPVPSGLNATLDTPSGRSMTLSRSRS